MIKLDCVTKLKLRSEKKFDWNIFEYASGHAEWEVRFFVKQNVSEVIFNFFNVNYD